MKQTRNLVSFDPANFEMFRIHGGSVYSLCRLEKLFLDTLAVILRKRAKSLEKNLSPALEMQFCRIY